MTLTSPSQLTDSSTEPVLVQRTGHTMVLTLNRPEARNAINLEVTLGVGLALDEADENSEIRAVIELARGRRVGGRGHRLHSRLFVANRRSSIVFWSPTRRPGSCSQAGLPVSRAWCFSHLGTRPQKGRQPATTEVTDVKGDRAAAVAVVVHPC